MSKYVYPLFPAAVVSTPFFRLSGNGLANCLFVYAKAILTAKKNNIEIIAPTWFNLSIGTYLRLEPDKRHYLGLFHHKGEITGFRRLLILLFCKKYYKIDDFNTAKFGIFVEQGIYDFFRPLKGKSKYIKEYIEGRIISDLLKQVNQYDFSNCIAVHVRLGDFPEKRRVPMDWYQEKIKHYSENRKVLLFSDGTDKELEPLLSIDNVIRANFGSSIQDILAISRCSFVIGSDSSFSAWGVYLNQVPSCFYRLQFGYILDDESQQIIENIEY